ncbi:MULTISPECIES: Tn3 family transposase [Bacillus]|uniref:Transposase X n=3 Tax=Bacillus anthracis TaxID=1392 RepID=Q6EZM4_BACAN|nr:MULTISPECIES: Tn3 family transposase [Bacillus]AAM26099.1 transposase X [Bacillus anthracis str. A2012]ARO21762.1 DDE transposase [Bacillus cereus]EJT17113.1 transposase X [Bacillus anthracis str. UR-1]AAT28895.2 transposase X [Bacillus anthracis str. 'Ames Ancestor']AHE87291.2 Tn3 family transposase [Bacillus anthracis str. A16R]
MKTRELLTDIQRTFFYKIPSQMDERELIRYYTLSDEELQIVNQQRGDHNRLGFAIQISYPRFPGRPLLAKEKIPQFLVNFLAKQIGVASWEVQNYARTRDTTRREHVNKIRNLYNLRTFTLREYRELARWLLPLAMKTENGYLLVEALIQEMRKRKIILPAVYAIEHLAWSVRERARKRIFKYLTKGLSSYQYEQLDTLLYTHEEKKSSLLSWLRQPPGVIALKNFHEILDRLEFIQSLDLPLDNGKEIHQNRLIQMAREGSRYSIQHLSRFNERKRYATIMAFLIHIYAFLTDQGLDMFAKLMGRMFNRGENKHNKLFQKDGKSINEKVRLYVEIGKALIEAKELETDPFEAVQSIISWEKFIHSVHEAESLARPIEFDYLDLLDNHYGHFRKMAPRLLNRYVFKASSTSQTVLQALELLKEANQSGKRKIPDNVPTDFIKSKWMKYVYQDDKINRHYYEFSVFSELLNTLRSGDMWVKGSKQYKDFEEYLLPPHTWQHMKQTQQIPLEFTEDVEKYLNKRFEQLDIELSKVNCLIANQDLQGVTIYGDKIQVASLKKMVPEDVEEITRLVYDLLPRIKLTDLLVEVDTWTQFSKHFVHLHTQKAPKEKSILFAAILSDGINLGLSKMADACPNISYSQLAWIADWYIRDESYTKALGDIANFHHKQPFSSYWGEGTTSSSDGQFFRAGGTSSPLAQVNGKYGHDPGLSFYTHISDQYHPFYVQVISSSEEAPHIIDGLLYHETDLQIEEHYTDAAGFVDHIFGMCHMLGFRFSPRIKTIDNHKIYTLSVPTIYDHINFMVGGTIQVKKIRENWDEILRLVSSVRQGTVTASLILKKLSSYPRQNSLCIALREIGRIERSLYMLKWIQDPEHRRKVQVELNKGESKNSLARAVFFNQLGEIRDRSYEDQLHRASGLQLIISAIVTWNSIYISRAIETLRNNGIHIPEEYIQHISPLGWEHIALTGDYIWNLNQELNFENLRPLRKNRIKQK